MPRFSIRTENKVLGYIIAGVIVILLTAAAAGLFTGVLYALGCGMHYIAPVIDETGNEINVFLEGLIAFGFICGVACAIVFFIGLICDYADQKWPKRIKNRAARYFVALMTFMPYVFFSVIFELFGGFFFMLAGVVLPFWRVTKMVYQKYVKK